MASLHQVRVKEAGEVSIDEVPPMAEL